MNAQRLALSFSTRFAVQLLQLVTGILVARILGPGVTGIVAAATATTGLWGWVANLGTQQAYIKFLTEGKDEATYRFTYRRIQLTLNTLFVVVVGASYLGQKFWGVGFRNPVEEWVLVISLFQRVAENLSYLARNTFTAKMQQAKVDIPEMFKGFGWNLGKLGVALAGGQALALAAVGAVSSLGLSLWYNLTLPPAPLTADGLKPKFEWEIAKRFFRLGWPIIIVIIANAIKDQGDKAFLNAFAGPTAVGLYAAGERVSGFLRTIGGSMGLLLFPLFSKLIHERNFPKINESVGRFERFNVLFLLPPVVLTSVFAPEIVRILLSDKYLGTIPILEIDAFGTFIFIFITPYGNLLLGNGNFKLGAMLALAYVAIFGVSAWFFMGPMNLGAPGLAYSVLVATLLQGIQWAYFTRKRIPGVRVLQDVGLLCFAVVTAVGAFVATRYFGSTAERAIIAITYMITLYGLGTLLRLIHKKDWAMVATVFSPSKMKAYLKDGKKGKKGRRNGAEPAPPTETTENP